LERSTLTSPWTAAPLPAQIEAVLCGPVASVGAGLLAHDAQRIQLLGRQHSAYLQLCERAQANDRGLRDADFACSLFDQRFIHLVGIDRLV
jgi:hypothetical protein